MRNANYDKIDRFHLRNTLRKVSTAAILSSFIATGSAAAPETKNANEKKDTHIQAVNLDMHVSSDYCRKTFDEVDGLVRKHLYSEDIAKNVWPKIYETSRPKVLKSQSLIELDQNINEAIKQLHLSHCQFVTTNDETYYFLHSLFPRFGRVILPYKMDYTGIVCGGKGLPQNRVRYVVNGSPAASLIQIGDLILSVNGKPYLGQSSFFKSSGKKVRFEVERSGKQMEISLTPVYANAYLRYVNGCPASAEMLTTSEGKIGVVRVWTGGIESRDALESVLQDKLKNSDGLILDLRDGYGGNSLTDLDFFYRNPAGYPDFTMTERGHDGHTMHEFYDKPLVVLINGGSRSGKELLAYSLKRSGRAKLVGEKTAGYVLGGRLFQLNSRASLYLAVTDCVLDGKRLEGNGVEPDFVVTNSAYTVDGDKAQFEKALEVLKAELKKPSPSASPNQK